MVTALMIASADNPRTPAGPNILPTAIPITEPIQNFESSRMPPRFSTLPISPSCSVVPRHTSWIPMAVAAPALENVAVVREPSCSAWGKKVFKTAPISSGTIIIPAGTFLRKFIIIVLPLSSLIVRIFVRYAHSRTSHKKNISDSIKSQY